MTVSLASDTGISNRDGITTNGVVSVSALAADASAWFYSTDAGSNWSTGSASAFSLAVGSYGADAVQIRLMDTAGNVGPVSKLTAIVVDTTAPSAMTASLATDAGLSASDGITNLGVVNVGALATDLGNWHYSTDGGTSWTLGSATAFTLPEGSYSADAILVQQTDVAGNTGAAVKLKAIVVDNTAPNISAILDSPKIMSVTNGMLDTYSNIVKVQSSEPSAVTWSYSVDSGQSWTAGSGTNFTLNPGRYRDQVIQVRGSDLAGNVALVYVQPHNILANAVSPIVLSLATDTGMSASDGITNLGVINVGPLASDGSGWAYTMDGGNKWVSGRNNSGVLNFTLPQGSYAADAVQVRRENSSTGYTGPAVKLKAIVVDTTAPSGVLTASLATDTGLSNSDGITANGVVSVGALAANEGGWDYSTNNGVSWRVGSGRAFTLPDGSYAADSVQVRMFDVAGNTSAVTKLKALLVDTMAPAMLTASLLSDTGASSSDGITTVGVIRVGALAADANGWVYSTNSGTSWTLGSGSAFALAAGSYPTNTVQVRQFDAAGNSSVINKLQDMQVNVTPQSPVDVSLATDSGVSGSDGITNTGVVIVNGLSADASGWVYTTSGGSSWSVGSGNSFTLEEGTYTGQAVQVSQYDLAGNTGLPSKLKATVVDNTAPNLLTASLASDTGVSRTDGITTVGVINIGALASDFSSWTYSLNSGSTWTTGVATAFTLAEGSYAADTIQIRQTDLAGNIGAVKKLAAVVVDNTAPSIPLTASITDAGADPNDRFTSIRVITVGGLAADTGGWAYSTNGGASWVTGSATEFTLAEGLYASDVVQVRQTDLAGNSGPVTKLNAFRIDITPPPQPMASLASDTGVSNTDGITSNRLISVAPLASDAISWWYSVTNGLTWYPGSVNRFFTLQPTSYAAGFIQVRQVDLAGNFSLPNKLQSIVVDVTKPSTTLAVSLVSDTGVSASDGITGVGLIAIGSLDASASGWEYSIDNGVSWKSESDARTNFFSLSPGTYAPEVIQVRQFDLAGNRSDLTKLNYKNLKSIIVDPAGQGLNDYFNIIYTPPNDPPNLPPGPVQFFGYNNQTLRLKTLPNLDTASFWDHLRCWQRFHHSQSIGSRTH